MDESIKIYVKYVVPILKVLVVLDCGTAVVCLYNDDWVRCVYLSVVALLTAILIKLLRNQA